MLKNWCFWTVVLEKTLESPLDSMEIQPVHPKGNPSWIFWCWTWNSNTLATWGKELTHLKRPWCWERLKAGGEGDDRGWHGWMASLIWWTRVSIGSRVCWWTGRPGVLQGLLVDREAWGAAIHVVAKRGTGLSDWTELIIGENGLPFSK